MCTSLKYYARIGARSKQSPLPSEMIFYCEGRISIEHERKKSIP